MPEKFEINKPWGAPPEWMQDLREAVRRAREKKLLKNTRELARQAVNARRENRDFIQIEKV